MVSQKKFLTRTSVGQKLANARMLEKSSKNKWLGVRKGPAAAKRAGVQSSITKFLTASKSAQRTEKQQKPSSALISSLSETAAPTPTVATRRAPFARTTFSTRSSAPVSNPTQTSNTTSPSPRTSTAPLNIPSRQHRTPAPAAPAVAGCVSNDRRESDAAICNTIPLDDVPMDPLLDLSGLDDECEPQPFFEPTPRRASRGHTNRSYFWRGRRRGGWRGRGMSTENLTTSNCTTFYNHYDTGTMSGDSLGIDFGGGGWEGVGCMTMGDMTGEEMNYDDFDE